MAKKFHPVFLFVLLLQFAHGQNDSLQPVKNVMYLELAGIGGYSSLNYERVVIFRDQYQLSARAGISTYHIRDYTGRINPDMLIPVAIYGSYGKKHKAELGLGMTVAQLVQADLTKHEPERVSAVYANFTVGYRYQRSANGFFFSLRYSPILEKDHHYRNWGGIAIGYAW